jgi:RNA recognition motif-containing protein
MSVAFLLIDSEGDHVMKLYVGNLPYSATEDELRTLFAQAGTVSTVELIKDRDTGSSKGFAFIEMSSQSEGENAIKMFNGYSLNNRELKVNIARPREERKPYGGGGYQDRGGSSRGGSSDRNRHGGGGGSRRY